MACSTETMFSRSASGTSKATRESRPRSLMKWLFSLTLAGSTLSNCETILITLSLTSGRVRPAEGALYHRAEAAAATWRPPRFPRTDKRRPKVANDCILKEDRDGIEKSKRGWQRNTPQPFFLFFFSSFFFCEEDKFPRRSNTA